MRRKIEIETMADMAFDIVWYMRTHTCDNKTIEKNRKKAVKRIEKLYPEVKNMSDFDYAYWEGVLSTIRWVMGEEEGLLDT